MRVRHDTPFAADLNEIVDKDGSTARVAVFKATLEFRQDLTVGIAKKQVPVRAQDVYLGEPGKSSLLEEGDGAYYKPATDVVVVGSVFAPGGRPTTSCTASWRVGNLSRSVLVTGDRVWEYGAIRGPRMSSPNPFTEMPLCWERAYGGTEPSADNSEIQQCEPRNPVGTGFRVTRTGSVLDGLPVANFEDPRHPIRGWSDRPPPCGFGFVGRIWPDRLRYAGTYDNVWREQRMPILPEDFDYRYFNAAGDGVYRGHLRGNEEVNLENLTPHGRESFRLPGLGVVFRGIARQKKFESEGILDTLILRPAERRFTLLWRLKYRVQLDEPSEVIDAEVVPIS